MKDPNQCLVPGEKQSPIITGDYSFNTGEKRTIDTIDYLTFIALLVTSTLIGIFAAWKAKKNLSLDDYLMAGRNENVFVAGFSRATAFTSSLCVIGCPMENYLYTTNSILMCFTFILINLITAECYMPVFYRLRVTSLYEYLELRFSRGVRTVASAMFIVQSLCYSAPVIFLPSLTLNAVAGFDLWYSIVAVTTVATLYSTVGGTKAVLWTDAFQMCIMLVGMLVIAITMYVRVGSFEDVYESASRTNRLKLIDFSVDLTKRNTMFSLLIGALGNHLPLYAANHTTAHRCNICKTLRGAKQAIWVTVIGLILFQIYMTYAGLYMGYLYENCDPLKAGLIKNPSEQTALFMMDVTKGTTGLMGVFMAFLFSASLSTISSALNSASTVFLEDFVRVYISANIRQKRAKIISQSLCLLFGLMTLELTYLFMYVKEILSTSFMITGAFMFPILGCISLGLFVPQANWKGAYSTLFTGFFVQLSYVVGRTFSTRFKDEIIPTLCISNCNVSIISDAAMQKLMKPPSPITTESAPSYFFSLSHKWVTFFNLVICIFVGITVSWITGFQDGKNVDARLTVPLADVVFPFYYLPEKCRKRLRCGVKYTDQWKHVPRARTITFDTEVVDAASEPSSSTLIGKKEYGTVI